MNIQKHPQYSAMLLFLRGILAQVCHDNKKVEFNFFNNSIDEFDMLGIAIDDADNADDMWDWNDKFNDHMKKVYGYEIHVDRCDSMIDILENHTKVFEELLKPK